MPFFAINIKLDLDTFLLWRIKANTSLVKTRQFSIWGIQPETTRDILIRFCCVCRNCCYDIRHTVITDCSDEHRYWLYGRRRQLASPPIEAIEIIEIVGAVDDVVGKGSCLGATANATRNILICNIGPPEVNKIASHFSQAFWLTKIRDVVVRSYGVLGIVRVKLTTNTFFGTLGKVMLEVHRPLKPVEFNRSSMVNHRVSVVIIVVEGLRCQKEGGFYQNIVIFTRINVPDSSFWMIQFENVAIFSQKQPMNALQGA